MCTMKNLLFLLLCAGVLSCAVASSSEPSVLGEADVVVVGGTLDGVRAAGYDTTTVVVVTNTKALPGVGPVLAEAIVDRRAELGAFRTEEDVLSVPGIGAATYEKIAPYITY